MSMPTTDSIIRSGAAAALAELPRMSPSMLATVLADDPPELCWERLLRGEQFSAADGSKLLVGSEMWSAWRRRAARIDVEATFQKYSDAEVRICTRFDSMPGRLATDTYAPAVLFARGDLSVLARPTVGIVGTRRCSYEGRTIARELGATLAEAGVCVVSGLALGIDGAAHEGALSTPVGVAPAGVVGSGLNVVYPRRHESLWRRVGDRGVLISEAPLSAAPEPWRFPARNRIIAALADVVVVVESGESGGSLLTVSEAEDRNRPVMAVPGSIRNRAAAGTNMLLAAGASPVLSADDVLGVLGLRRSSEPPVIETPTAGLSSADRGLLDVMTSQAASLEQLALRSGRGPGALAADLSRLEVLGLVESQGGYWQRLVAG